MMIGFARTLTAIYALVLLSLFLRIQLNLVGRHTYMDSVELLETSASSSDGTQTETTSVRMKRSPNSIPYDVERKYLALSWFFLNKGLPLLQQSVEKAVKQVMGGVSLSAKLPFTELMSLIQNVRKQIQLDGPQLLELLMPSEGKEAAVIQAGLTMSKDTAPSSGVVVRLEPALQSLIDETRDFIERLVIVLIIHLTD